MVIYEINAEVKTSAESQYLAIAQSHREQLLRLKGFKSARRYKRNPADEGRKDEHGFSLWTIHYEVQDRASLEDYFQSLAPHLRAETERLGSLVKVHRRILESTE